MRFARTCAWCLHGFIYVGSGFRQRVWHVTFIRTASERSPHKTAVPRSRANGAPHLGLALRQLLPSLALPSPGRGFSFCFTCGYSSITRGYSSIPAARALLIWLQVLPEARRSGCGATHRGHLGFSRVPETSAWAWQICHRTYERSVLFQKGRCRPGGYSGASEIELATSAQAVKSHSRTPSIIKGEH